MGLSVVADGVFGVSGGGLEDGRAATAAGSAVVADGLLSFVDDGGAFAVDVEPLGPRRLVKRREPGERFFGCGERTAGLEKTGSHQIFWNVDPPSGHTASFNNLYTSIPFTLSLANGRAYGLFFDNTHRVEFDLALEDEGRAYYGAEGGDLV